MATSPPEDDHHGQTTKFIESESHAVQQHRAVDEFVKQNLLRPEHNSWHSALEHAYYDSLRNGCPDHSTTPIQGKFLAMQAKIARAKNILEVGTLGGYSTIWMASASPDIKITTIEIDEHYKTLAEDHFKTAGVDDRVTVLLGHAKDVLVQLVQEVKTEKREAFDFVFVDADKDNNLLYFKMILDCIKPQTPIFVDNVVRQGKLVSEEAARNDPRVQGTRLLVEEVGKMSQVEAVVIQTVGEKDYDGFMLALTKSLHVR